MNNQVTTAERISAAALTTQGMPIAQRAVRAGLKPITIVDMRKRFACDAIEKAQNELVKCKLIDDFCEANGMTAAAFGDKYVCQERRSEFKIVTIEEDQRGVKEIGPAESFLESWQRRLIIGFDMAPDPLTARKKVCSVKTEAIDHYAQEIPDRVLSSYSAAKELGFRKFKVAYPVIEDAPRPPDPILLAELGEHFWEIDCWE